MKAATAVITVELYSSTTTQHTVDERDEVLAANPLASASVAVNATATATAQQQQQQPVVLGPFAHAVAGGVGGVIALTCTYPLDIIKTRMQVQSRLIESYRYSSITHAFMTILRKEGITGLYTGLQSGLIATLANQFIYFYFYEFLKPYYYRSRKDASTIMQLLLGINAAALNVLVTVPISVVNTRMQTTTKSKNRGLVAAFRAIYQEEGIAGLWSGLQPSLILTINPAITYLVYEKLKVYWIDHLLAGRSNKKVHLSAFQTFLIGAIAKTISTIVTYPYIMAKVRLQWKNEEKNLSYKYKGTWDVLRRAFRNGGVPALFQGMSSQIMKGVLTQAIQLMMKEEITQYTFKLLTMIALARTKKLNLATK